MRNAKAIGRNAAIRRGLEFIYRTACDPQNFEMYGHDYLGCFHCIASTSKDVNLRRVARKMGRERALQWRREYPKVPADADADAIAYLVFGSYAADRLGVKDIGLKEQIRAVADRFDAQDYLGFDAATEAPPQDVPEECECGACNTRGRKTCRRCKRRLTMMSSYGVWLDALIASYMGERYGVRLGAWFADVIKWLPTMRPYPKHDDGDNPDFHWAVYAVTHVVYTLNDYSCYSLSPSWLPHEYAFLKRNLKQAIVMDDPETMGEFLDTLKSFGLPEDHPLIVKGLTYLLSKQNPDGSWGDVEAADIYERYHPTWTAIDGLREYAWHGQRLSFQRLRPLLACDTKRQVRTRAAAYRTCRPSPSATY
ncbi:MAG TPA: hypothetical protein VEW46_22325 [Pyrinomonadaceae bacterium]|nr:hypothetical protein [Pyrinomonadaceae bacterium]